MPEIHGHCLCNKVSYSFTYPKDQVDTVICHCHGCQRSSGSAFSLLVQVNKGDFKLSGPVAKYSGTVTSSGKTLHKYFCGECGSKLVAEPEVYAPIMFVYAGSINDDLKGSISDNLKGILQAPSADVWNKSKLQCISQSSPRSFEESAR
eukprot:Phypoly_transcript_21414.p1 GENE.Phypoly_transcript_21414~~Phypoly_transcript_21414.p1  ORF type:complete len:149 (+),score=6.73 Phypoly_transcript_21414:192-638(+)